jgi:hypothetical protein
MSVRSRTKKHSDAFEKRRFEREYNKPLPKVIQKVLIRPKYPKPTFERDLEKLRILMGSMKKRISLEDYPETSEEERKLYLLRTRLAESRRGET